MTVTAQPAVSADRESRLLASVPTGLLINGEWRDAASGKTFDVEDPATGKVLLSIADAGAEDVVMAPASVVRTATGQAIGGVAPAGHPAPLRTYIDEALREHDVIWAAAGHPHTVMPLTFASLQELTGGEVVAVV